MTDFRAQASEEPLVVFDLSHLADVDLLHGAEIRKLWDTIHFVVSLQGIMNRKAPRLFLRYIADPDDFWWNLMTSPGEWMHGRRVVRTDSVQELLSLFAGEFAGLVVWDEKVPATSNLASTLAGVESLLCVRFDPSAGSLCSEALNDWKLTVRRRFVAEDGTSMFTGTGMIPGSDEPSTGSAKNDAYRWLVRECVSTGRCNAAVHGYYVDAYWLRCGWCGRSVSHTLTNHDFVIANRGILWDLNVWSDESPVDDPDQTPGTDEETLEIILRECNEQLDGERMIHVAGYVPWRYKYTDCHESGWDAGGRHGAVSTEWRCTQILSSYNAFLDADALDIATLVNSSFFMHFPLPDSRPMQAPVTTKALRDAGLLDEDDVPVEGKFYAHYCGDYDAAAWLYWMLPQVWTDKQRGWLPLSWAFNPNLGIRFPYAMDWVRRTATEKDVFVAGDCGAGYVNPYNLSEPRMPSGLPSGVDLWERHCEDWMKRFGLDVVGFIIDGHTQTMKADSLEAYTRFSPGGFIFHRHPERDGLVAGVPFSRMAGDLPKDAIEAAEYIHEKFSTFSSRFLAFRSVILPPSWYVDVQHELARLGGGEIAVDLRTLLGLIRQAEITSEALAGE